MAMQGSGDINHELAPHIVTVPSLTRLLLLLALLYIFSTVAGHQEISFLSEIIGASLFIVS